MMKKLCLVFLFLLTTSPAFARYVDLTWDAVAGATSYRLYWGPTSGGPYIYEISDDSITTNSYDQLPINQESTYFVVTAVDGTGESLESSQIIVGGDNRLTHNGYDTPEQIAVRVLDISWPDTMTASIRYRKTGTETWTTGHDLYHVNSYWTNYANDGFSWVYTGLEQGTDYHFEVTLSDPGEDDIVYNQIMSTRSLPAAAGAVDTTIPALSNTAYIQNVFDNASAGDVIQFADGTYTIDGLEMTTSGTADEPIYIRGESRDGVILIPSDTTGRVLYFINSSNVILENLTIQGSGVDSYVYATSIGIEYYSSGSVSGNVTFRNLNITGVDKGIITSSEARELLVYENVLQGNNTWTQDLWGWYPDDAEVPEGTPDIEDNSMWNDDGIRIGGNSNVAFNNTLDGFGDAFSSASSGSYYEYNIHFYRNKITMTGDDGFEIDDSDRNISVYDNHITNSGTFVSFDYTRGGPFLFFRNVSINSARQPFKMNSRNDGMFFFNNTVVRTKNNATQPPVAAWGWSQDNNGAFEGWGYQNNILIYQDETSTGTMSVATTDNNPIDFTNNSWYPDDDFWWSGSGGSYSSLSAAYAGLSSTTPVFSSATQRHEDDLVSELQPFETAVVLGSGHRTEITTMYTPTLSAGGVNNNSGTVITGVTDGYSGVAPDRGAIIEGRSLVTYGATVDETP